MSGRLNALLDRKAKPRSKLRKTERLELVSITVREWKMDKNEKQQLLMKINEKQLEVEKLTKRAKMAGITALKPTLEALSDAQNQLNGLVVQALKGVISGEA